MEKHFTLDKRLPGPDHVASADPAEFSAYVAAVRGVEVALGSGIKEPSADEINTAEVARKSIVAARDLPAGRRLEGGDLACKRPGSGIPPSCLHEVVGRELKRAVVRDALIRWEDLG